jgi:photosystem II stability/assembly factor-like uncharacterized protein
MWRMGWLSWLLLGCTVTASTAPVSSPASSPSQLAVVSVVAAATPSNILPTVTQAVPDDSWRRVLFYPPGASDPNGGLLEPLRVSRVVTDPAQPGRVYALAAAGRGTCSEVYVSQDHGGHWMNPLDRQGFAAGCMGFTSEFEMELAVAPDGSLYFSGVGIFARSIDGGRSWQRQQLGVQAGLAVDSQDPAIIYVGARDPQVIGPTGVYRSRDSGASWEFRPVDPRCPSRQLHSDPFRSEVVYFLDPCGHLHQSTNAGDSWTQVELPDGGRSVRAFALSTVGPARVLVVARDDEESVSLWESRDDATHWQLRTHEDWAFDLFFDPRDPQGQAQWRLRWPRLRTEVGFVQWSPLGNDSWQDRGAPLGVTQINRIAITEESLLLAANQGLWIASMPPLEVTGGHPRQGTP